MLLFSTAYGSNLVTIIEDHEVELTKLEFDLLHIFIESKKENYHGRTVNVAIITPPAKYPKLNEGNFVHNQGRCSLA